MDTELVHVPGRDDLEAAADVITEVAFATNNGGTDAGVDGRVEDEVLRGSVDGWRAFVMC